MKHIVLAGDSLGILVADISDLTKPTLIATMYHKYPLSTKC